jgi:acetylornithine deacetylase/succinyl-diaminopimelate desuccinylase-like protein
MTFTANPPFGLTFCMDHKTYQFHFQFSEPCVDFLKKQADEIGLDFKVVYPVKKEKPVVILTYFGLDPNLKSILLNSHMDVVAVFEVQLL